MWIDRQNRKPKFDGAYTVFGAKNKGTEPETYCKFTAYWDSESSAFTDKDGDDFTCIDEGVIFWFDFNEVPDPI